MTAAFGDLAAGATLGRYELLLPLAQGGMAQVWAARLKGTRGFSKTVAIKTMLPALSADPRFEQMFLSEAEIASRIKHPNVCEILDLGEQDGVLYLVMEWIEGESLVTLASGCERAGRRIPFEVSARLVLDAAKGLHAAHELQDDEGAFVGVVHRDVSPHNILVTPDGHVKIVDFGVAKAVARADHQTTHAGSITGKVQYMAPEQAFGEDIDRRADVFALGIVLYQLTTGDHPFRTDNELATLQLITAPEPVPSPSSLVPDYPAELDRVVMKALAKDRDARYATMAELAQDLDAVLASLAAAGHAVSAEAFAREALGARAAERAATLRAAARAADEQTSRSSLGLGARALDEATTTAPVTAPSLERSAEQRKAGRGVALAAALGGVGLGLGVAALLWASRTGSAARPIEPMATGAPLGALVSAMASSASAAPAVSPSVASAPTASAPTAPVAPTASAPAASARAQPKAPAAPGPPTRAVKPADAPREDAKAKFRNPGF